MTLDCAKVDAGRVRASELVSVLASSSERPRVPCDVVHQQRAMRSAIVRVRDRTERLLSSLQSTATTNDKSSSNRHERVRSRYVVGSYRASRHSYRVPDLQLDALVLDANGTNSKLDANRELVVIDELAVGELQQQAALADTYTRDASHVE